MCRPEVLAAAPANYLTRAAAEAAVEIQQQLPRPAPGFLSHPGRALLCTSPTPACHHQANILVVSAIWPGTNFSD